MKKLRLIGLPMLALPAMALAEVDPYTLSLEDLMSIPVMVSSRIALSQRETPGIVTVITGEEIRHSGARDLIDVLRQVPGFDFRMMINNGLGLGVRGHIGSDGRVLMLVDGIEVNEHRYGSAVFGQGFPIEQVARIEIIRGSALALYGGSAELGVINVITRSAEELNGVHVGGGIGAATSGVRSRWSGNLMAGKGGDGPVKWTAMAHMSSALRSDRTYQDVTGPAFNMAHANAVYLRNLNLGLQSGDFSARYLRDEPQFNDRDSAGFAIRAADSRTTFSSDSLLLQYRYQMNSQLTLTPNVLYQDQNPRKVVAANGTLSNETSLRRVQAKLPATLDAGADWHFAGGLEYVKDDYKSVKRSVVSGLAPLPFDSAAVTSLYGEALWYGPWGNLTASARLDEHGQAGLLRAERLGYTRVQGDWHVKLAGSHASSAPSLEDYAVGGRKNVSVKPETSHTWEMEAGYRISSNAQLTVNLFDVTTYDTLLLTNTQTVHTRGMEAGYKIRQNWGYADVSYSYYNAKGTDTNNVQVIDRATGQVVDGSMNMAFPSHKLAASLHYILAPGVSLNPSLVYLGSRWGYTAPIVDPVNYEAALKHFAPTPLLSVVMQWENAGAKGLDVTLGLYNALNKEVDFIQPFNAGHAPLPDMSREVLLQAQYKF